MQECKLFFNYPFINSLTGVPLSKYFNDAKTMMNAQIQAYEMLNIDPVISPDFGTVLETGALGGCIRFDNSGYPVVYPAKIATIEDVKHLKVIDPYNGGYLTKALEMLSFMKANAPRKCKVNPIMTIGPFTVAAQLQGISDFCLNIYDDPDMVKMLLDIIVESEIIYLKEQEKILGSLDCILIGDDISSFVSEELYREFVMPTYEKIYNQFPYTKRWLHNDANAGHLAGAIADCGFELWHVGDCIDIVKACQGARYKVKVVGNLSPTKCLKDGTVDSVSKASEQLIERFDKCDKYILSAGGYISFGTPLENVLAMIRVAKDQ